GASREREVVSRSHAATLRAQGRNEPRSAGVQGASPADTKNYSPCPAAEDRSGPTVSALYVPNPRSWSRPLVIGAKHHRGFLAIHLRGSAGSCAGGGRRSPHRAHGRSQSDAVQ